MKQEAQSQNVLRPHVEPNRCGHQNEKCYSRFCEFKEVRHSCAAGGKIQLCYFHAATRKWKSGAGRRFAAMPCVLKVNRRETPRTTAPFATCAVVTATDFAVQIVNAPSVTWSAVNISKISAGFMRSEYPE